MLLKSAYVKLFAEFDVRQIIYKREYFMHYKKSLALMVMCASSGLYAGSMGGSCQNNSVTTPCEQRGWLIGGQALYLQPTSNIYGVPYSYNTKDSSISFGVEPSWGWGYQFEAAYLFHTGNDFNINWYHYRHTNSVETKTPLSLSYTYSTGTSNTITVDSSSYSVNPQWDQVNFEFGQQHLYDRNRSIRIHGGAQYSRVANHSNLNEIGFAIPGGRYQNLNDNEESNAAFNGFGPRIGMDLNYAMPNGISIYAKGGVALLAGNSKSNYLASNVISINSSQNRVIPSLDGKLGFNYNYAFRHGELNLDMGWLWADYINTLSYLNSYTEAPNTTSSFEIQGLYFGLKWQSNAI